ncbi:hypothetical protein [Stenotrophomonas sp. PS02301]|uniref:hypothetical protein n=1 Tax=Stenotrophomonas sp. PS02301 TaxID=2991427 RepID=UPI00249CE265|nr:hypothetical protein [Stenotrophomonas sp. PS02301]
MGMLVFSGDRSGRGLGDEAEIIIRLEYDSSIGGKVWEDFDGAEGSVITVVDGKHTTVPVEFTVQTNGHLIEVIQPGRGHLFSLQGLDGIRNGLVLTFIASAKDYDVWNGEISLSVK